VSTRLVSVVVPTKDVGRTIRRCLESIRAQDHRELELIVVDNFSGDATFGVAQELADVAVHDGDGGPARASGLAHPLTVPRRADGRPRRVPAPLPRVARAPRLDARAAGACLHDGVRPRSSVLQMSPAMSVWPDDPPAA